MKLSNKEYGYIDTQLTTVIVGILLLIGLVHMVTNPEFSINSPSLIIFPGIAVVLAIFAFGYYCNMSSLKCPESPFNKHVSPIFLALIIIGSLAYALWKVNKSPYHYLVFVFGAAIAATIFMGIYLEYVRTRTQKKIYKPDTRSPAQHEADIAVSKAGLAFSKKEYYKVVQILEPHLKRLPQSQRKRYDIAMKHIQK